LEDPLFATSAHGDDVRKSRLSAQGVDRIVKRYAKAAGLEAVRLAA
jgi:hypothetical protein